MRGSVACTHFWLFRILRGTPQIWGVMAALSQGLKSLHLSVSGANWLENSSKRRFSDCFRGF